MGITAMHFQSLMIACVSLAAGRARVATFSKRDGATWCHIERVPSSTADTQRHCWQTHHSHALRLAGTRASGLLPFELCPWTMSPEWCCLGSHTEQSAVFLRAPEPETGSLPEPPRPKCSSSAVVGPALLTTALYTQHRRGTARPQASSSRTPSLLWVEHCSQRH